jgi:uncharacterized membrane protein YdjX (TVP38/TMEM64 family)
MKGNKVKVGNVAGRESRFSSRMVFAVVCVGGLITCVLGLLLLREIGTNAALEWVMETWARLQKAPPIVFFGAMALLTIFPVPLTPFYIVAGSLFGILPSLLWIPPAIVLNNLIAHTLTTSFLRPWLQTLVARRGQAIPTLRSKRDQSLFIAMVRITPGIPYFLQSLLLGLAGVDRLRFLVISISVHMIYVVGFVVLGRSAFDGEYGVAIIAIALLVVASLCARFVHQRLNQIPDPEEATSSD